MPDSKLPVNTPFFFSSELFILSLVVMFWHTLSDPLVPMKKVAKETDKCF